MNKYLQKLIPVIFIFLLTSIGVVAQPIRVAVAANAQYVLQQLKSDFQKKTGIAVEIISGSSGKLTTQIKNGAPYDIFLSADMDFVQTVYKSGLALTKPRVYALGSLIVCSATGADLNNWKTIATKHRAGKVAIANPDLAPYGKAAEQSLNHYGLYQKISPQLVFAESISQVNTYVLTKVVALGFTTASLVYEIPSTVNFKWIRIDPSAYSPIQQGAVLLKHAKNSNYIGNKRFYAYLFSPAAKAIFKKYGYGVQ